MSKMPDTFWAILMHIGVYVCFALGLAILLPKTARDSHKDFFDEHGVEYAVQSVTFSSSGSGKFYREHKTIKVVSTKDGFSMNWFVDKGWGKHWTELAPGKVVVLKYDFWNNWCPETGKYMPE